MLQEHQFKIFGYKQLKKKMNPYDLTTLEGLAGNMLKEEYFKYIVAKSRRSGNNIILSFDEWKRRRTIKNNL